MSSYEELVQQEDELAARLKTADWAILNMLDQVFLQKNLDKYTLTEILTVLGSIKHSLERELTLLRLDKAFLAARLGER